MIIAIAALHKAYLIYIGVGFWFLDLFLRLILVLVYKKKIKKATLTNLPGNIIRLVFELNKDDFFRYKSGQYVCICIPEVSWYEWHPLSISSSPHETEFSLHFSVVGSWTKKLQEAIKKKGKSIPRKELLKMESNFSRFLKKHTQSTYKRSNSNSFSSRVQDLSSKIKFQPNFEVSYIKSDFFKTQKYLSTNGIL